MFKETAWRLATQMLITVMAVVTSVIVNRLLGPTNKGMYLVTTLAVATIIKFGNLGIGQAVAFHTARETFPRKQQWSFAVLFSLAWGSVLGLLGLLVIRLLPSEVLRLDSRATFFLVLGALTLFSNLGVMYLRYYILGMQRFGLYNRLDLLRNALGLAAPVTLLILLPDKLIAMFVSWLLVPCIVFMVLVWLTREAVELRRVPYRQIAAANVKYGVKTYVMNLLQFMNYRLDNFVLNFFLGATQVGLYSVAVSLGERVWQLANAVQTVLFPKVASTTEEKATSLTVRANRNTVFLSALAALGLGVCGYWVIYFLYGKEFLPAYEGLLWLLPGIVTFSTVKILTADLAGRGRPEIGSYVTGGALVFTLVFDFLLIPERGLVGAAQASTLAYTSAAVICTVLYVRITKAPIGLLFVPQREDFQAYARVARRAGNVLATKVVGSGG